MVEGKKILEPKTFHSETYSYYSIISAAIVYCIKIGIL